MQSIRKANRTIEKIYYKDHTLFINVLLKRSLWEKVTGIGRIELRERNTDRSHIFLASEVGADEDYIILQATIAETIINKLMEAGTLDLYLQIDHKEMSEQKQYRIKSNFADLELLYYMGEEEIFHPYTTNEGNVSFKTTVKNNTVLAMIDSAEITQKYKIMIKGYTALPDKEYKILSRKLILRNKSAGFERYIPLTDINRNDLAKDFGQLIDREHEQIGFEAQISLSDLPLDKNDINALGVYVQLTVTDGDKVTEIESTRLKFKPGSRRFKTKNYLLRESGAKRKLSLSSTKVRSYFSIRFPVYSSKAEMKKKLIKVKRSKKVKKLYKQAFKLIGLLPANKKLVMFESFLGKQYSCNPRAIYEYMQANHPEYKMIWSVDKKYSRQFREKNIKYVNRFSIRWLFLMASAGYWVTNSRMPLWIPKPRHTKYLQTWHGTPLKRLAADMDEVHMPGTTTAKYKKNFHKESSNWDFLVSPNAYSSEIFERAFNFKKQMIESGYPRNDYLYHANNETSINQIKNRLKIPLDKKVILYAPTWRDDQFYGKGKYKFDLDLDLNLLQQELGDEYVILFRMHYLVAENLDLTPYKGFAYDFSQQEDINELYIVSDLLITDYSSVFFDYANLRRPILFYVYDIENYRDKLRGFYIDFEENAPGPLVRTSESLINEIKDLQENSFNLPESFTEFHKEYCYLENGNSSRRVVETFFNK